MYDIKSDGVILIIVILISIIFSHINLQKINLQNIIEDEAYVTVEGKVYRADDRGTYYIYYLKDGRVSTDKGEYSFNKFMVYDYNYTYLRYGNRVKVTGEYSLYEHPTNRGGFDEYTYYKSLAIEGKVAASAIEVTDASIDNLSENLRGFRSKLKESIENSCNESDAGVFEALLLGDKQNLSDEIKDMYKKAGISHILAISGLHIAVIGSLIYNLLRKMTFNITAASIISAIIVALYVHMTGNNPSSVRAVMMFMVMLLARITGRTYDIKSSVCLVALCMFIYNPDYIHNSGVLLSFGAIAGIVLVSPALNKLFIGDKEEEREDEREVSARSIAQNICNRLRDNLIISLSISIMTFPIIIYYYYEIPVYSVLINVFILIPVSYLAQFALASAVIGIFAPRIGIVLMALPHYILLCYEKICIISKSLPFSNIITGRPDIRAMYIYYALLLIFIIGVYRRPSIKKLGIIFLMYATVLIRIRYRGLLVAFIDVGQGDGIYMQSASGNTYMIDGGSSSNDYVGKYTLIPYLKSGGISNIDYIFVTHSDRDHISGVMELLEQSEDGIRINNLVLPGIDESMIDESYLELINTAKESNVNVEYINRGTFIEDGSLKITCIHPDGGFISESANAYSTVLDISYMEYDMLLTGDLEGDGEDDVIESGLLRDYDVLKVAHHGSKGSTSEVFLSITKPEVSVISSGRDNSYGHPHEELLNRLRAVCNIIYNTQQSGCVTIKTDGKKISVTEYMSQ